MNREVNTIGSKADGLQVSELDHPGQGRARADAGAGAECRVGRRGLLFIVSAPSGTGKTTLVERLVQVLPNLRMSRSYTSRPARAGERDGVDYNFISREAFDAMIAAREFLEWADVFGNYYGTSAADVERMLAAGQDVVLGDRRAGRAAGEGARRRSHRDLRAAAVVRGARAAAARPQQGHRGADAAPAGDGPRRGRRATSTTTTSWSTTSSSRPSCGCRRSSPPSDRATHRMRTRRRGDHPDASNPETRARHGTDRPRRLRRHRRLQGGRNRARPAEAGPRRRGRS